MIKLRTALLYDKLYIILLILVLIISMIRININKTSKYNLSTKYIEGIVTDKYVDGNKLELTIKGKEKIICFKYFSKYKDLKNYNNNYNLGDKVILYGDIVEIENTNTKNIFNYKKYLKRKNIFYNFKIEDIEKISNNSNIYYLLKRKIISKLNNNPYLLTFILGDKRYIKQETKQTYQNNGISHLFAISGMHINLLAGLILKLLKKINIKENKRYYITSIILILYLFLTGISASILRGVLFFILFSINKIYYFYIKNTNIFIITLSISLLINPFYLYDVACWYSFSISLSLLSLEKTINKYNNYFIKLLITSLISFIVSIPITLYNFYQINILSIIYNLFYVPLVSIIIFPLSLLTYIIPILEPVYKTFTNILELTSYNLNKINILKLIFPKLNYSIYILYYIFIIMTFKGIIKNKKIYSIPLILLLLVHYLYPYYKNDDYIKMIDIGQGDSFLLYSNNKTILIDTGGKTTFKKEKWQYQKDSNSLAKNITIPLLKSLGIKKIDYLILTHGDFDHAGEAINLIDNFNVGKIYINEGNINYTEEKIIKKSKEAYESKEGVYLHIGDLYLLELNRDLADENDSSSIYYITYKRIKMLFTGDASIKSENYILKNYDIGELDILKVGHHGSKTSTSEKLLKETKPKLALISAGKNNRFNHPNTETINKLNKYNINYLVTLEVGTVTINLNTKKITIGG